MLKRFRHNDAGASAVEFALIAPILIAVVFAAIEFALIFFSYNAAGHVAWSVARQLATNQITTAQVPAAARASLPTWVQAGATITSSASSADPTTNQYTVTISFPASSAAPTQVLGWAYGSLVLTAKTTMQQEPTS